MVDSTARTAGSRRVATIVVALLVPLGALTIADLVPL
jgi:hypothetical protein